MCELKLELGGRCNRGIRMGLWGSLMSQNVFIGTWQGCSCEHIRILEKKTDGRTKPHREALIHRICQGFHPCGHANFKFRQNEI